MPVRWSLLLLLFSFHAQAAEIVEEGLSVKALGMGNAYLSRASGHDALFYNPAGFASLKGMHIRVLGLGIGINGKEDMYNKYKDIVDEADTDMAGALNKLYGNPLWGRTDVQTSFNLGSFIFGGFGRANVGLNLQNPAFPTMQSSFFADYGFFAGWGGELVPSYLDVGGLVKRITRRGGNMRIGPADLAYLDSDRLQDTLEREGTGYAADLGLKLKIPLSWNPTVSAAWQNMGRTSFSIGADGDPPPSLDNDINLGLGLEKDLSLMVFHWGLDYRHSNMTGEEVGKKFHTGVELEFPFFALRGGFNQGYYTAGASLDLWFFQLDAATYGVELGEYPGQDEDRRYIVQFTIDLGFDSAGNIINLSRSRRSGIKQRR